MNTIEVDKAGAANSQQTYSVLLDSERHLRLITDNVAAVITYIDTDQRYRFVNKAFQDVVGLPLEDILGKTVSEFHSAERHRQTEPYIEAALRGEQTTFERVRTGPDGIARSYQTTYVPHIAEDGAVVGAYGVSVDITQSKQTEQIIRAAREEAELASRAKSESLANISHELRTPLNSIIGFSDLLTDKSLYAPEDTNSAEYATLIYQSGEHLLALINDILDISKIEAGTAALREEDIDLAAIIKSCCSMVAERVKNGGIDLIIEATESDLPLLRGDKTRIKQVILNLLSNAVKFSEPASTVTVKTWLSSDSGFGLQVIDTGIGIASDDIPRALARFQQVESNLSRAYEGTGLGLPLSKALVEQHGGSLDLQSQVGVGTTVTVRLPVNRVVTSDQSETVAHIQ